MVRALRSRRSSSRSSKRALSITFYRLSTASARRLGTLLLRRPLPLRRRLLLLLRELRALRLQLRGSLRRQRKQKLHPIRVVPAEVVPLQPLVAYEPQVLIQPQRADVRGLHLQDALVRALALHHRERSRHERRPQLELSMRPRDDEHPDVAAVHVPVLLELAHDDADRDVVRVREHAQLGPVVDEVSVREDAVRLGELAIDEVHHDGHVDVLARVGNEGDVVQGEGRGRCRRRRGGVGVRRRGGALGHRRVGRCARGEWRPVRGRDAMWSDDAMR
eukprot:14978-Pelagococcus_subviridis.AAC.3